ncbi:MAG: hypothetical protein ABIQ46_13525 [Alteraurantiacibacter sp.]
MRIAADRYKGRMLQFAMSLAMLSALVLLGGAWWLYRKHGPNRQTLLMAVMALVLVGNVVIWAIPLDDAAPDKAADSTGPSAAAD